MLKNILSSKIYGTALYVYDTILLGRVALIALFILGMFSYHFIVGTVNVYRTSAVYDMSTVYYVTNADGCDILFNSETLNIVGLEWTDTFPPNPHCIVPDTKTLQKIVDDQPYKTRAVITRPEDVYGTYIVVFAIYFLVVVMRNYTPGVENWGNVMPPHAAIVLWVILSLVLFPVTFRDNVKSASHEIGGRTYYVTSAYLSKNRQRWIKAQTTFIAEAMDEYYGYRGIAEGKGLNDLN